MAATLGIAIPFDCREKGNTFKQQPRVAKREKGKGTRLSGFNPSCFGGKKINKFTGRFSNFSRISLKETSSSPDHQNYASIIILTFIPYN